MIKFEVGKTYMNTGLYTGPYFVTVVDRDKNSITVVETSYPNDGYITYPTITKNGIEYAKIWDYQGQIGYMQSN